jgi:D-alanyl-D-alanine carboxypeptidase/D-alanyl-D-alanine-endopeptidase (penicillin-binding protein 4)
MKLATALFVAAALHPANAAAPISQRCARILAQSPIAKTGFVGMLVEDGGGRRLFAVNADRAFVPASNTKLFSTAFALERLGPDHRFETRVEQRGDDLVLVGTGDANLSGRVMPYVVNSEPGPALTVIDELAVQVADHGIHEVAGDVIGDDTAFVYEPYGKGWTAEDVVTGDGAPVSALMVHDNTISVRITPTVDGTPATVAFDPPTLPFEVNAKVTTGTASEVHQRRLPYTNHWDLWGTIKAGDPPFNEKLGVDDPALFAAQALKYSLEQHGVAVRGSIRAIHRENDSDAPQQAGQTVATHESLPLIEDLRVTNKTSQNAHADLLLSDVAGSRSSGLQQLGAFLGGIGIHADQYCFYDGSGISRLNLVTPAAVITLLTYMAHSAHAADWISTLPVSGVDGSLSDRMTRPRVKGRIMAKTGTLMHTSALSGYAHTRSGRRLTFCIFVNNAFADAEARHELIDKLCAVLVD